MCHPKSSRRGKRRKPESEDSEVGLLSRGPRMRQRYPSREVHAAILLVRITTGDGSGFLDRGCSGDARICPSGSVALRRRQIGALVQKRWCCLVSLAVGPPTAWSTAHFHWPSSGPWFPRNQACRLLVACVLSNSLRMAGISG